jgi:BirA family biotin operon repressor/biotin-[acetyl-CoA-carboxylase] ligase
MPFENQPVIDNAMGRAAISSVDGWTLHEYAVVTSTNLVAAGLPVWSAVRADTQTAGRGRFQRAWVSDAGGLWLSAVVPLDQKESSRRSIPLAIGLAVADALEEIGIRRLRMRWPNDLLVGARKLAGLLIDEFAPGSAVVGIGLNVANEPEARDPQLRHHTVRLKDLLPQLPSLSRLTALVLGHVRRTVSEIQNPNGALLNERLKDLWGPPRQVELDLNGELRRGHFAGVDPNGRLILADENGNATFYEPHQVRQLTEI